MREYTVLLDPPVFAPNSVAPVQQAMPSVGAAAASGQISRPAQPEPPERRTSCRPLAAGGGDSYEVQRGDSLSAIARRLSASTGAGTTQLMVSIYRANSGRFRRRYESPARGIGAAYSEWRGDRRRVAVRSEQ